MLLSQIVRDEYPRLRQVSDGCLRNYAKHVADLQRFVGRPVHASDLTPTMLSRWLVAKLNAGRSPYYVSGLRSSVLAVWELARELDPTIQVAHAKRIRCPDLIVRVWSPDEVRELANVAAEQSGQLGHLSRGEYLSTLILGAWHSGLRRGDLHRIRKDQLRDDGTWVAVQHKSGRSKPCRLPVNLIRRARLLAHKSLFLWPKVVSDEVLRRRFKAVVDRVAEKKPVGWFRGRFADIRRSAEHDCELRHPGRGHLHGGHERRTFERYYDATQSCPLVEPVNIV